jgi:hypothetical protein
MKLTPCAVLAVLLCFACADALVQSYKYDVLVALEGILVSSTADPAITYDEKPHQFPALKLRKPISVLCAPNAADCQPETGVTLLHLVLKQPQRAQFKSLKGKAAKLRGTLFHSDSAHHFTSVLLDVESITP